jgi:uncharacterized protein (TIGR01777 family)
MKIVIPGGSGQLGAALKRAFSAHEVVILRRPISSWAAQIDGADVVINLAGRTVNCRYSEANLKEMMDSRVESTRAVGEAIAKAKKPPRVWLQMSTATIYAHRFDAPNDEATGIIGGAEPGVPALWGRSIDIAKAWEKTLDEANTPHTRKVAMRTAMIMGRGDGGVFATLLKLVRLGLGGRNADGKQFVSWMHEDDFTRAVMMLIERDDVSGAVNLASPNPLPNAEFMAALREAAGRSVGLPAAKWMLEVGAFFMRTETELLLKSRRVVPGRLLGYGFEFQHPSWPEAAKALTRAA